ncbi:acetamidase [Eggerthellaceae bacterium zg-997]|nr:acetamidase [Eggerthellaceae bacterium zg-997]
MQTIRSQVYRFSRDNEPCARVAPGEVLVFSTLDCFSNRLTDEGVTMATLDYGYDVANPAAGPVYVEGAEPGDVLVVDVYDIAVADEGTIATDDHCGPLHEGMPYATKKVPIRDGYALFNEVRIPVRPMIGVIGCAPDGPDVIDGYVGSHGGNMDNRLIGAGTRLHLPVRVPGALLQMGDVHAAMGDAEICGTGIEIPARITVRVSLVKGFVLNWPVLETADRWYVNACGQEYDEACKAASAELHRLLSQQTGWSRADVYMYMSVQCDLELNQACKPCAVPLSLRFGAPKLSQLPPLIPVPSTIVR